MRKLLVERATNINIDEKKDIKIEYKYNYLDLIDKPKDHSSISNEEKVDEKDSFIFSNEIIQRINNSKLDVKNTKIFPYSTIGTISVKFPISDEVFEYTWILIDVNVVVTLASNLENKNKGGRAISIMTSFSKEKVKWENIYIQGEEKGKIKNVKNLNENKSLDNISSKLAVILYGTEIGNEWLGVEMLKKEDLEFKDKFAVFPLKEVNDNANTIIEGEEKVFQQKFRELFIYNANPFLDAAKNGDEKDLELIKKSPGTPLFYRDFNNGAYVIAIINESFEFQYLDKKTMIFLANMVNKGKIIRKKENRGIDEENIIQLDLQKLDLGPLEIAYLIGYNLVNLRILDLSCNSLRGLGSFYLGKVISIHSEV